MDGFRRGRYKILVATDVAARGIDVCGNFACDINYDIPATTEAYTHRVGRTGRACKTGDAHTFVAGNEQSLARSITRVIGKKLTMLH
jgi:superfamily II DNA/RNA helicase